MPFIPSSSTWNPATHERGEPRYHFALELRRVAAGLQAALARSGVAAGWARRIRRMLITKPIGLGGDRWP